MDGFFAGRKMGEILKDVSGLRKILALIVMPLGWILAKNKFE